MNNTLSYVSGASTMPLIGATIGALFDRTAAAAPLGEALVVRHQGIRWTWQDLRERVDRVACGLIRLGLNRGDRIGIWAPNCAEWLLVQLASAKAGLILATINPAYRRGEVEYVLNKVDCKALVLAPSFKSSDYIGILTELAPELAHCAPGELRSAHLPELRLVVRLGSETTPGMLNFAALLEPAAPSDRAKLGQLGAQLQFDEPVNIQFTSGTTGAPKGATLTHHNILNNAHSLGAAIGLGAADRLCIPVPLYHCFGMVGGNLACIAHQATMVYPAAGFDAQCVLETIQAERCTVLYGVPTMFIAELARPDFEQYDLSSLRTGTMAGSPCPAELVRRVIDSMHIPELTIAYGMTETSPVSFQTSRADPIERRTSTVGRTHPHIEVKLVDLNGEITARGQPGELCVRGYSVMRGYWNDPEKTAEAIDEAGWMHTGDLATIDADGYCQIVGRLKDMIIRGGENVYPREIEEFLFRHPCVADVAIVGVPDERYGEEVCAWIKLRAEKNVTEEEIRAFCRGQLAHYKVPAHIVFVDAFPLTATGKIQKFAIREQMMRQLGR